MKKIICLSFVLLFCFTSCEEDSKLNKSDILGNWNLFLAERNGNETGTLKGAYFNFQSDSSFISNIFGEEQIFQYVFDKNRILKQGDDGLDMKIESLVSDTMIVLSEIQKNDFRFYLAKSRSE